MKTDNYNRFLALLAGGALLCLASAASAQNDPSGTWDFVISGGHQQGVAFVTFDKDFSLSGFEVITSYTPPTSDDGRLTTITDRNPSGGGSSNQFIFGFTAISGHWNFDSKGRTIGFINEGEEAGGDLAQSSSFVATVNPGRRMTMKVTDSPNPETLNFHPRRRVYKGIPLEPTDDVSGDYSANGSKSNDGSPSQNFTEFFHLHPFNSVVTDEFLTNFPFFSAITNSEASVNAYFLTGEGPGYTNWGLALYSAQKKMAIVSVQNETSTGTNLLRSVSGTFNVGSGINGAGKLYGLDDDSARLSFKVNRLLP